MKLKKPDLGHLSAKKPARLDGSAAIYRGLLFFQKKALPQNLWVDEHRFGFFDRGFFEEWGVYRPMGFRTGRGSRSLHALSIGQMSPAGLSLGGLLPSRARLRF